MTNASSHGEADANQFVQNYEREMQTRALWSIARNLASGWVNRGALVAILLTAANALVVARYQRTAALAILRHSSLLTVATGVAINMMPLGLQVAAIALAGGCAIRYVGLRTPDSMRHVLGDFAVAIAIAALVPPSLLVLPLWFYLCLPLVGLLLGAGLRGLVDRTNEDNESSVQVLVMGLTIVVVVGLMGTRAGDSLSSVWLPAEQVELTGGKQMVGYVLEVDDSGEWTTVLRESDRQVVVLPSRSVQGRKPCRVGGPEGRPSWVLGAVDQSKLPVCPSK